MLLSSLLLATASIISAPPVPVNTEPPAPVDHGKLSWFEGSFEALLEKAEAEGKILFLDFWADW
jgi:thiol:disulfide interchange protein